MSNEIEKAVARPFGVAAWLVPIMALGIVGLIWLSFFSDAHVFSRVMSNEKRGAEWVGEKVPPKAPVNITVKNDPRVCVRIDRALFNGDQLSMMALRTCGKSGDYAEAHWKVKAADGTVLTAGYTNWEVDNADLNGHQEWIVPVNDYNIPHDPRITDIVIWTSGF